MADNDIEVTVDRLAHRDGPVTVSVEERCAAAYRALLVAEAAVSEAVAKRDRAQREYDNAMREKRLVAP